jgi:hypothetical protein
MHIRFCKVRLAGGRAAEAEPTSAPAAAPPAVEEAPAAPAAPAQRLERRESSGSAAEGGGHVCVRCGRVCGTAAWLTRHSRVCTAPLPSGDEPASPYKRPTRGAVAPADGADAAAAAGAKRKRMSTSEAAEEVRRLGSNLTIPGPPSCAISCSPPWSPILCGRLGCSRSPTCSWWSGCWQSALLGRAPSDASSSSSIGRDTARTRTRGRTLTRSSTYGSLTWLDLTWLGLAWLDSTGDTWEHADSLTDTCGHADSFTPPSHRPPFTHVALPCRAGRPDRRVQAPKAALAAGSTVGHGASGGGRDAVAATAAAAAVQAWWAAWAVTGVGHLGVALTGWGLRGSTASWHRVGARSGAHACAPRRGSAGHFFSSVGQGATRGRST